MFILARRYLATTPSLRYGVAPILLATVLWSSSTVVIDHLVTAYHLTPLEISAWRALLAAPLVALFIALRQPSAFQLSGAEIPYYLIYGLTGVTIFYVVWTASIQINKASVATALLFSSPVFVAVGDRIFFGERLRAVQLGAIAANLLGCALVVGLYAPLDLLQNLPGLALGLGSGLTFGLYTLFGRGAARARRRGSATILLYVFLFGAMGLLSWGFAVEGPSLFELKLDAWGWCQVAGLAAFPTLGGYALFNTSLKYLPATLASLFATLEPPITALLAFLFLGRSMNGPQWLGTGLIVGGVAVMQMAVLVPGTQKRSARNGARSVSSG